MHIRILFIIAFLGAFSVTLAEDLFERQFTPINSLTESLLLKSKPQISSLSDTATVFTEASSSSTALANSSAAQAKGKPNPYNLPDKLMPLWDSMTLRQKAAQIIMVFLTTSQFVIEPGKSPFIICMQAVETLIYRIAGTAGLAMHLPLTSTGNNLAYRKSFFMSVNGFTGVIKIQSGDDDLLMQKLASDRPWAMRYCITPSTFVTTNGKETLKELWEQRKRWASKTIYYTPKIVFVLSMVFLFLVMLCVTAVFSIFNFKIFVATLIAFLCKSVGDMVLIIRGLKRSPFRSFISAVVAERTKSANRFPFQFLSM